MRYDAQAFVGILALEAQRAGALVIGEDLGMVEALHGVLARTPARLLGVLLPDLVGDRRRFNQPGTAKEQPEWRSRSPSVRSSGAGWRT